MLNAIVAMVRGSGRQRVLGVLGLVAAALGVVALIAFFAVQTSPPTAISSGRVDPSSSQQSTTSGSIPSATTATPKTILASQPTSISIPAIGVKSAVVSIGKTPQGQLAVPEGKNLDKVAWYDASPTPGQIGPSVVEGHIDTVHGPSVLYRLAALRAGNKIIVDRADGSRVTFTVSGIRTYPKKSAFPTKLVYGGDLSTATLRLVTCAAFDRNTGHYAGNAVVFAQLTHFQAAK